MYRQRVHFFPKTMEGYFAVMKVADEYNKLAVERGWTQATSWMPTVGENELVWEADYPDLATLERETKEQFADPDMMPAMTKLHAIEFHRPMYSELLEPPPSMV